MQVFIRRIAVGLVKVKGNRTELKKKIRKWALETRKLAKNIGRNLSREIEEQVKTISGLTRVKGGILGTQIYKLLTDIRSILGSKFSRYTWKFLTLTYQTDRNYAHALETIARKFKKLWSDHLNVPGAGAFKMTEISFSQSFSACFPLRLAKMR